MTTSIRNNSESGHSWLDAAAIEAQLRSARPDPVQVRDILERALTLEGLAPDEVAVLMGIESPDMLDELFNTAKRVKETIYGKRIVLFAPLFGDGTQPLEEAKHHTPLWVANKVIPVRPGVSTTCLCGKEKG
jgi:hypothetical protein